LKGMNEDELPDAVERVLQGHASLPGNLVARLIDEFRDRERFRVNLPGGRAALLSPREWEVLELMRSGSTTAEIAERLFVSQTTVRSHISAILRKLEVHDRSEAIELMNPDRSSGSPPGP
jgi:DNA-binding NarL/FixJ family response regulator